MGAPEPHGRNVLNPPAQHRTSWLPGVIEAAASLTALYAMGALLINKTDTKVAFFGETPTVTADNVSTYHHWLVVFAFAVAFSFCGALWRRSPTARSTYWHGLVLVAGLIAAAAFHVAVAAPTRGPGPVPDRSGTVCHSGSGDECVGG